MPDYNVRYSENGVFQSRKVLAKNERSAKAKVSHRVNSNYANEPEGRGRQSRVRFLDIQEAGVRPKSIV